MIISVRCGARKERRDKLPETILLNTSECRCSSTGTGRRLCHMMAASELFLHVKTLQQNLVGVNDASCTDRSWFSTSLRVVLSGRGGGFCRDVHHTLCYP